MSTSDVSGVCRNILATGLCPQQVDEPILNACPFEALTETMIVPSLMMPKHQNTLQLVCKCDFKVTLTQCSKTGKYFSHG